MKVTFIMTMGLALFVGCASSTSSAPAGETSNGEIDAAKAKELASAVVPGVAGAPAKLDTAEEHRWVVTVTLPNGAPVDVELARTTGLLEEIKGEEGPFDYEIAAPKPGLMAYGQATTKALAAKAGKVEAWEVKPPKNLYEFYVRDDKTKLWEIKMTADKGDIQSILEKATRD